jgi:hypothetical protein
MNALVGPVMDLRNDATALKVMLEYVVRLKLVPSRILKTAARGALRGGYIQSLTIWTSLASEAAEPNHYIWAVE